MKKFGFTLAEVLVTLGIIGVVAALTMPSLVSSTGSAKIGPSLAKFANSFENAMNKMKAEDYFQKLKSGQKGTFSDIAKLSKYLIMVPYDSDTYTFVDGAGNTKNVKLDNDVLKNIDEYEQKLKDECVIDLGHGLYTHRNTGVCADYLAKLNNLKQANIAYLLNDNSIMVVIPVAYTETTKGSYKGVIAEILLDIDGKSTTNAAGRDVFAFLLDASGTLIPAGSAAHKYIEQSGGTYVTSYETKCDPDSSKLTENFACTGKIADNGWSTKGMDF